MYGLGVVGALALGGCEEPVELVPVTEPLVLTDPDRIEVGSAIGPGRVEIPFRILNSYGATIPGKDFEVLVTGESLASYNPTIEPDALGFGTLVVESELSQQLEVTVIAASDNSGVGSKADSWITAGDPYPIPLQRAYSIAGWSTFVERATGGVVYVLENQVFYQRTDLAVPPQEVLALPDLVAGMTAVDLDRDGYLDLVVWSDTRVVLLRGRGLVGYAWSTAFITPGSRLRGVDVADFDGDRLPDLAIGFADIEGLFTGAQVLIQDGYGNWDPLPPLRREVDTTDVALGDFVGEGLSELILLTADGPFRYGYNEDWTEPDRAWNRIDPDLTWLLDPGATLLPSRDLDGEGTPELIGSGTAVDLDDRQHLSFYTIGDIATRFDLGFPSFAADVVDITGDGVDDIVVLIADGENAQLRTVTTDAADGTFKNRGLANLPVLGELAIGDLDSDGDRDVVVGGSRLWVYEGDLSEGSWGIDDAATVSFGLSLAGPVYIDDWDGDGRADVLAVREVSDGVVLQAFEVGLDAETGTTTLQAYDGGQVSVDDHDPAVKAQGLDLVVCDQEHIYLLVSDGETVAWRLRRDTVGGITAKASGVVDGHAIACGDLVSGAVAAVVNESGDVTELNISFGTIASYNLGSAAYDIAIADLDGGGPVVVGCSTPGCSLAVLDMDGDGVDELLEGGDNAVLHLETRDVALGTAGLAGVADLDGDGLPDLVLTDTETGAIALHQYAGGNALPAWWLHTRREMAGPAVYADADADGIPELWFVSTDGTLVHTARSGTSEPATGDTGDTGE